jgi:hypothetical protein
MSPLNAPAYSLGRWISLKRPPATSLAPLDGSDRVCAKAHSKVVGKATIKGIVPLLFGNRRTRLNRDASNGCYDRLCFQPMVSATGKMDSLSTKIRKHQVEGLEDVTGPRGKALAGETKWHDHHRVIKVVECPMSRCSFTQFQAFIS